MAMPQGAAAEEAGLLWLATLQRALGRASHDIKDSLNGVSVNLEVIRSRAARPDAPASAVAQFAEAAGHQLERLTSLIEAVLALGRPERDPADVARTQRRIVKEGRA
jgi:signal transduction histidine kinase